MVRTIEQVKDALKQACFIEGLNEEEMGRQLLLLWGAFKFQVWHECPPSGGWGQVYADQMEKLAEVKSMSTKISAKKNYFDIINASISALERVFYEKDPWDTEFVYAWITRMKGILSSPILRQEDQDEKIHDIRMMDIVHEFREHYYNWYK